MSKQEKAYYARPYLKKFFIPHIRSKIVHCLIFVYVLSIFFLELTLIPNRIALFAMLLYAMGSAFYQKPSISWDASSTITQGFFFLPFLFFVINGCNMRPFMLNSIIPVFFFIFSTRAFRESSSTDYLYSTLNISVCIVFVICMSSVLLKISDDLPVYWWNDFVHRSLVSVLNFHPSYLSLFVLIAINGNLNKLYQNISKGTLYKGTLFYLIITTVFLVLIAAKMAYIILFVFYILFLRRLFAIRKFKWTFSFLLGLMVVSIIMYKTLPSIKDRVTVDYRTFVKNDFAWDNKSPASERIYIWRTSTEIIKRYPLGQFCKDTKNLIWAKMEKANKQVLEEKNAHNNFLEFGLRYGVFGILLIVLFLILSFRLILKHQDFLFLGVFLIFVFFSLTESTAVRELGVIYMAFFYQYHVINPDKKES
ncbi:O-antigen ligase family protein [Muricauda brasiliensis]|uniref:O-antigen ligase family protein n=1 Tax=Muricauda brasiliensis TaxID=2162892 RepID=UPI000D3C55C2|nr:O-antigen ligase family protein [Muricauda brasiliensis]